MSITDEKEQYRAAVETFNDYISEIDLPGLKTFFWYHTVDLGNGVVTPGDYDYRNSLTEFQFPEDMRGLRALDVGSASGFFAFEFERRGAEVVSVELPSIASWDMIAHEKPEVVEAIRRRHAAVSPDEAYYRHLDGPFQFCHAQRKSSVKRVYSSIYDLTLDALGGRQFDIIFLGDILAHLFSPMAALNAIAPLCKGKLVIGTGLLPGYPGVPIMQFLGTVGEKSDRRSWWLYNQQCLEDMIRRVGFEKVALVGSYSGIVRRAWIPYHRYVLHAEKPG